MNLLPGLSTVSQKALIRKENGPFFKIQYKSLDVKFYKWQHNMYRCGSECFSASFEGQKRSGEVQLIFRRKRMKGRSFFLQWSKSEQDIFKCFTRPSKYFWRSFKIYFLASKTRSNESRPSSMLQRSVKVWWLKGIMSNSDT